MNLDFICYWESNHCLVHTKCNLNPRAFPEGYKSIFVAAKGAFTHSHPPSKAFSLT